MFATPKLRRQRLFAAHHYPPEFFFSVTNHGIGRLRELYGDGASLVRKTWRRRPSMGDPHDAPKPRHKDVPHMQVDDQSTITNSRSRDVSATAPPEHCQAAPAASKPPTTSALTRKRSLDSLSSAEEELPCASPKTDTPALQDVLEQMSVLSLVPRSVRKQS